MTDKQYLTTIACPEAINNCYTFIQRRLQQPNTENHTNIMLQYALEYVCPSSRSSQIIDYLLEQAGTHWRMHSFHVLVPQEVCRIIMRKASLVDLTTPAVELRDYEKKISSVLKIYSDQYAQPLIIGPSNLSVFSLPEGGHFWVYTRVFDMWEYDERCPEQGWKEIT